MTADKLPLTRFYPLESPDKDRAVCKVCQQYFEEGHRVFILTNDDVQSRNLDTMLWTYRQESFIPHEIIDESTYSVDVPVVLSTHESNRFDSQILIIAKDVSEQDIHFYRSFNTIIDFADKWDEILLTKSRQRYKFFHDLGFTMQMADSLPF